MAYGNLNVDTITGSGASSVIVNNGTNNVAGFTTGNNLQMLQNGGGIVFSNSSATTNSTLSDYETGTFTITDNSGAGLSFTNTTAQYTKIGNLVYFAFDINFPTTANTANISISLPFRAASTGTGNPAPGGGIQAYSSKGTFTWYIPSNSVNLSCYTTVGVQATNVALSNSEISVTGVYKASF